MYLLERRQWTGEHAFNATTDGAKKSVHGIDDGRPKVEQHTAMDAKVRDGWCREQSCSAVLANEASERRRSLSHVLSLKRSYVFSLFRLQPPLLSLHAFAMVQSDELAETCVRESRITTQRDARFRRVAGLALGATTLTAASTAREPHLGAVAVALNTATYVFLQGCFYQ